MEQVFRMVTDEQMQKIIRFSDEFHKFMTERTRPMPEIIGTKEIEEIYELTPYRIRQRIKAGTFPKPLLNYPQQYPRWNRQEVAEAMMMKREN